MPPAAESNSSASGSSGTQLQHHHHHHQHQPLPLVEDASGNVLLEAPAADPSEASSSRLTNRQIVTTGPSHSQQEQQQQRRKSRSTSFRLPFVAAAAAAAAARNNNQSNDEDDQLQQQQQQQLVVNGEESSSDMSEMTFDQFTMPSVTASAAAAAAILDAQRRRRSSSSRTANSWSAVVEPVDHVREAVTATRRASMQVIDSLTINKLRFDKVGLHGREEETKQLLDIWYKVYQKHMEYKQQQQQQQKQQQEEQVQEKKQRQEEIKSRPLPAFASATDLNPSSNHDNHNIVDFNADDDRKSKPAAAAAAAAATMVANNKVLTIVQGVSGVGKSQLVTTVLKKQVERQHGLFISGKWDMKQFDQPFNGIILAMDDLCDKILAGPVAGRGSGSFRLSAGGGACTLEPFDFVEIKELLLNHLKLELNFLTTIFPKLNAIVGCDLSVAGTDVLDESTTFSRTGRDSNSPAVSLDSKAGGRNTIDFKANADRLKHCVRKLIQVICSTRPLVIHLDDTHWADQESLDLLYQILTDSSNQDALMVVCSYRSDEVDEEHKMTEFLQQIERIPSVPVHFVTVDNLSVEDINSFLQELLGDSNDTMELAQVIYDKTQGNIFYVVRVLMTLHDKGLLAYNLGVFKWIWNADEIRENAPFGDNVVDLVKGKLQNDPQAKQLLPIAACIGSAFGRSMLILLVQGFRAKAMGSRRELMQAHSLYSFLSLDFDINELLNQCHQEGYIQPTAANDGYQFIHDRVQEAALDVLPDHIFYELKYEVGKMLADKLSADQVETMVFTILGLLSDGRSGPPEDPEEKLSFLKLNVIAGHKALTYSAFRSSSNYFKAAIPLLPDNCWHSHYDLTLDLYSSAAVAEYLVADADAINSMKDLCNKILTEPSVKPTDKLSISHVLIDNGVAQHRPVESMEVAVDMLKKCGMKIPQGELSVGLAAAVGLIRTKFSKKMQDSETVARLPISSNKADAEIMKTLDHLATAAYVGKPEVFPVIVLKSIRYTFDHGITVYSPAAFALVGLLLSCFMDDFAAGWKYAKNAIAMLKRLKCKEVESRTIFVAYTYPAQWIKPMQDCMKPLIKGYKVGLSTGDLQSAMYCAHFWCEYALYVGMPLADVDKNMTMYGEQMVDFGQTSIFAGLKMVHQTVRILRGKAGNNKGSGAVLSGDVMDQEDVLRQLSAAGDEFMMTALQRYRPILACYMGDYAVGAKLAIKWTDICCKTLPGQPCTTIVRFCSALCCYAMARKTKKKRYLKEAKRQHKFLRQWASRPKDKANPNCVHREMLLSAELDAAQGKAKSASKKFASAILMAGRRGILQDHALANERYAAFCLDCEDKEEYFFRMNTAIQLYGEWGAAAKVEQLKEALNPGRDGSQVRASSHSLGQQQDISSLQSFGMLGLPLRDLGEDELREMEQEISTRGFVLGDAHGSPPRPFR
jgi:predicted ATPase